MAFEGCCSNQVCSSDDDNQNNGTKIIESYEDEDINNGEDNNGEHSRGGAEVRGFAAVDLKIVFLPLVTFEIIILIDNLRMCKALMPGDEESMSDEAIWETLRHFWVAISMVFFIAATVFTLLKLSGSVAALGWWDLFINFTLVLCLRGECSARSDEATDLRSPAQALRSSSASHAPTHRGPTSTL